MEKKFFLTALVFSFLVHVVMIGLLSLAHSRLSIFSKPSKSLEVTYQKLKPPAAKKEELIVQDFKVSKSSKSNQRQRIEVLTKKGNMFSVIGESIKDISRMSSNLLANQKKNSTISTLDVERKITLPPMRTTKITNPQYITYNDDMRGAISRNIKKRAYTYINHKDFESGKVYLTFVLSSSGALKQFKIIDSKTSANEYLRNVATKSIQESNPFPPFPPGFNYPEFTFNLLISFQN